MRVHGGSSYTLALTSVLDGVGQRHALAALPPGKRPGIHSTEGSVELRVGLADYRNSRPHWVIPVFKYKNFLLQLCSIKEPYFECKGYYKEEKTAHDPQITLQLHSGI